MLRFAKLCGCAGLLALAVGCSNAPLVQPENHEADVQAVKDFETGWVKDYAAKDLDKAVDHYADDATLMIPNMPVLSGKEAIRAALKELLADPNFALSFQAVKVESSKAGDLVYTQGTYTMTVSSDLKKPKSKPINDKGKYLTIYRKLADGSFKAIEDIDNSDLPMPAAK